MKGLSAASSARCIALILGVLLLVACDVVFPAEDDPVFKTPVETYRTLATMPAWSPSGETVAFVVYDVLDGGYPPEATRCAGGKIGTIWLLDLATRTPRFLTCGYQPDWHPSGHEIVFTHNADVHVIDLASERVRRVNDWGWSFTPSYSPDGTQIVFSSAGPEGRAFDARSVYVMGADGSAPTRIAERGIETRWARDGTILHVRYFKRGAAIVRMNANGSGVVRLTDDERDDGAPVTSPNGRFIAWNSNGPSPDPLNGVWRMNADGSDKRSLAPGGWWPAWSPDGRSIVYYGNDTDEQGRDYGTLFTMNADGSNRQVLLRDADFVRAMQQTGTHAQTSSPFALPPVP